MLLSTFIKSSVKALKPLYPELEARSMVHLLCQERLGVMSWTHIVEPGREVPPEQLPMLQEDVARMSAGEPIQYVIGYTEFYGRVFNTDKRALIPRIETEMLVSEAVNMARSLPFEQEGLRVLDLCTGSGCVAWSLAYELPGAAVTASDISTDALDLARGQFRRLPKKVLRPNFVQGDILDFSTPFPRCELLTANPPYITEPERALMRPNVLDWEPEIALFAPESDPLAFHKAIALWAMRLLSPSGGGVVEINEDLGVESAEVFRKAGLEDVRIVRDFAEKERFISYRRP